MNYRYHCNECGKTYVGPPSPGMTCNCTPPKVLIGTMVVEARAPLSDELLKVYSIGEAQKLRSDLCALWGITNKSHNTHGANFSGNQTLVQLIQNIVDPITAPEERNRVRQQVIAKYRYDIDSRAMT